MQTELNSIQVRSADLTGPDSAIVSRLVEEYLRRTEFEKATHLGGRDAESDLPQRYRYEVESPAQAYQNATVYVAELNLLPVGVIVVQHNMANREIKRVWVEPSARGQRVGSALIDAVLSEHDRPVRLTVWDWRRDAVQLYRSRGFAPVASWEDRPRLVCMELPSTSPDDPS